MSVPSHQIQPKNTKRRWFGLIAVCLLILVSLAAAKAWQVKQAIAFAESFPERSESVTVAIAKLSEWQDSYRTIGEVKAPQAIELRNELAGTITHVGFAGGSKVRKGDVLLELDNSEELAQLDASKAQLVLADIQLKRFAKLREKKLASNNDYDQAKANKQVLEANIAALQARITKNTLPAPFTATTSLHQLEVGQYLPANSVVAKLTGISNELWLDFSLPQGKDRLVVGDSVELYQESSAKTNAVIIAADTEVNPATRSRGFRAKFAVQNNTRPGAVLSITVPMGEPTLVFNLPINVIRHSQSGPFVFVLVESEPGAQAMYRAAKRPVELIGSVKERVLIAGGIEAGDIIAAIGAFKLDDGVLTHRVERKPGRAKANPLAQ